MAKGQMRSNREAKKPKKDKAKASPPASPFASAQSKGSFPKDTGKKK